MSFLLFSWCLAELLLFVVFSSSPKVLASLPRHLFVMINLQQKYQLLHHLVVAVASIQKDFFQIRLASVLEFLSLAESEPLELMFLVLISWLFCCFFELNDHGQFFSLSEFSVGFFPSDSESQLPGEEVALWVLRCWWTIMFLFKIFFSLYWFLGI